jgi:redox-sensitive bicupin YhaK (pirin superfamily)
MTTRTIERLIEGQYVSDGAGVRLRRIIGTPQADYLDPFLMLDEFRTDEAADYIAGFPDHPHRGFETVTYMIHGRMRHQDSVGNSGVLSDGSVQWMTAGRGIIHSEMPEQADGLLWGYQLWVNLPSALKMSPPQYQDIPTGEVVEVKSDGLNVRVLAGNYSGHPATAETLTPIAYFDVALEAGHAFTHPVPEGHTVLIYIYDGAIKPSGSTAAEVTTGTLAILSREGDVTMTAGADGGKFLMLTGEPINEPVARMGPFIMTTEEEIHQAVRDYQAGTLA